MKNKVVKLDSKVKYTINDSLEKLKGIKVPKFEESWDAEPATHSFCETPEEKCTMNYCDENGCMNRNRFLVEPKMIECYFTPKKDTSSSTICYNCGKEKFLHTIGEGIKASKHIITKEESYTEVQKKSLQIAEQIVNNENKMKEEEIEREETLEEAAENYTNWCCKNISQSEDSLGEADVRGFKAGAKWQREQILNFLYFEIIQRRDYSASKMCEEVVNFIKGLDNEKDR